MESALTLVVLFAAISKTISEKFYKPIRTVVEKNWPESIGAYIADQAVPYVAWVISGSWYGCPASTCSRGTCRRLRGSFSRRSPPGSAPI